MYEEYFGLNRPPFKITPDTSLFYEGGKRGDILAALEYAIHRGEGIIKVVGEVGSGKTMLCRMLQIKLPDTVEIVYIANPSVSPQDILFVIAHELALPVTRDASKHEVMQLLQDYLLRRHTENKQVVLFVEEAQGMPLETLEEIRLLSNLETDLNKLLQIILFGQPELDQNLAQQSIRQLRERITHNFNLEPLTRSEIYNYLNFRMREVGYTGPELISPAVAKKVEQYSDGLLRRINIIADKILLSAFAEGTHDLSAKHVSAAVNDSTFNQKSGSRSSSFKWLGAGVSLVLVLMLAISLPQMRWPWHAAGAENLTLDSDFTAEKTDTGPKTSPASMSAEPGLDRSEAISPQLAVAVAELAASKLPASTATVVAAVQAKPMAEPVEESSAVRGKQPRPQTLSMQAKVTPRSPEFEETMRPSGPELLPAAARGVAVNEPARPLGAGLVLSGDYNEWLSAKLQASRDWLRQADRNKVSIQVLMRNKAAERELVDYLRNDWPLDLSKTYLYEVGTEGRSTFRVFYNEFDTLTLGRNELNQLPESIKVNSPYLDSVYRMQQALL